MFGKIPEETGHRKLIEILSRKHKPSRYLEVGVREGATIQALLKGHHPNLIALCDTWEMDNRGARQGHQIIRNLFRDMHYKGHVMWLDGPSQELIHLFERRTFDFVHIDGDHKYQSAYYDVMKGYILTKDLLIVHDYKFEEVKSAIYGVHIRYNNPPFVFTGDTGTAVFVK